MMILGFAAVGLHPRINLPARLVVILRIILHVDLGDCGCGHHPESKLRQEEFSSGVLRSAIDGADVVTLTTFDSPSSTIVIGAVPGVNLWVAIVCSSSGFNPERVHRTAFVAPSARCSIAYKPDIAHRSALPRQSRQAIKLCFAALF